MASSVRRAASFGKQIVAGIQEKNVPFMAASIAYQAFISLIPLLVLVFFLVTLVGDEQFAADVTAATEGFLPESGQLLVEESLEESPATAGSSLIGLVVLLWGALKIFRGLDTAFSEIFDSTGENSFLEQLRDALIVFGAIGGALIAAGAASIVFAFFPEIPYLGVLNAILLVGVLTVAFLPMYYYFPDVDVSVRQVVPGVVLAAVGWTLLQSLFQVYVAVASDSEAAGPVGAILLLLTWLYFGGLILLSGAVVNAVGTGYLEPEPTEDPDAPSADREPLGDDGERARDRLADRTDRLERERDLLRNDLRAQRSRRYRLEDRVEDLETTTRDLEEENERLRRELETTNQPQWRQSARALVDRIQHVRIGVFGRE